MKRKLLWMAVALLAALAVAGVAYADAPTIHQDIEEYVPGVTCLECHEDEAIDVAESLHYQHRGLPVFLDGVDPDKYVGMMDSF